MNKAIRTIHDAELALPRTLSAIRTGMSRGLHHGIQIYASRDLSPIVDLAVGENVLGEPLTSDHLLPWLSAGKPMTALAVLSLVEQGLWDLDRPVAELIPGFEAGGKGAITTRHLLTHSAGIDAVALGWPATPWEEIIARICSAPLKAGAVVGEYAAYDPQRSWFILGEIIQRVRQQPVAQVLRSQFFEPLGMDETFLAMPGERYEELAPRLGRVHVMTEGLLRANHAHQRETVTAPAPGSSSRGPIRQLGRFYEMLLCGGTWNGQSLVQPETIRQMTARHRVARFDQTFQHTVDFGLGIVVNSNRYGANTIPYGFGKHASEGSFGHGGSQSCIGFADPQHQLAVAMVANGYPGEVPHNRRFRELLTLLYEDLGLAK